METNRFALHKNRNPFQVTGTTADTVEHGDIFALGSKRSRAQERESDHGYHHVISQDEGITMSDMDNIGENDDDGMEIVNSPITKRRRRGDIATPVPPNMIGSPTAVSVPSTPAVVPSKQLHTSTSNAPWWKQPHPNRRQVEMLDTNDVVCHVCESVFTLRGRVEKTIATPATKSPQTSLLAYFKCENPKPVQTRPHPPTCLNNSTVKDLSCSFCELETCPDCRKQCESCRQSFCSFCCKQDYYGAYTRTLCPDCFQESEMEDETMQL